MKIIDRLHQIWADTTEPFLIYKDEEINFHEVIEQTPVDLSLVKQGDVVALIGDFTPSSILTLLRLIDLGAVVVPLTVQTVHEHPFFFESAYVDVIIKDGASTIRPHHDSHELIDHLRKLGHAGLILFSTGTTARPKAILHDLTSFMKRFETPRPTLRTINFLLFDHIGGINTLLHTLFNKGVVVAVASRTVDSVLGVCRKHKVEALPTTPTFLRMMLMGGAIPSKVPDCLKVITYGTERMDQATLDELCALLPNVDFRQTFGMSELGILRIKSEARDSLFMKIGGEGVETRVVDSVLQIRSQSRMMGYLNAPSPFDSDGWYDTKDIVETQGAYYKVVGRLSDVINVGGLKFMASDVEKVALTYKNVSFVKVTAKQNPITGQHVEMSVQPTFEGGLEKDALILFLKERLQPHMVPKRIRIENIQIGHRFKRA